MMNRKQGFQIRDLEYTEDDNRYITVYPVFSQKLRKAEWDRMKKMLEIELYKNTELFGVTMPDEIIIDSPDFFVYNECGNGSTIAIDIYKPLLDEDGKITLYKGEKIDQIYIEGFDECD